MCTRFTIASGVRGIEREFQAEFQYEFQKVYNAHFGMELPVILSGKENQIVPLRWGIIPFWSKEPNLKFHHINSPARNIVKNPVCRVPVRKRRCLVLANCFFVWKRIDGMGKIPFLVYDGAQRIMSFAGIWDTWQNKDRLKRIDSFSVITTRASKRVQPFSPVMPVIIPPGRRRKYLRSSCHLNEVMSMLQPYEADTLNIYPVSNQVNDFGCNTREVVQPAGQRVYKEYEYVPRVYLKLEGMGSRKDNPDRKPELKLML
jgi:putative SOS response-associated peptidase YedK